MYEMWGGGVRALRFLPGERLNFMRRGQRACHHSNVSTTHSKRNVS